MYLSFKAPLTSRQPLHISFSLCTALAGNLAVSEAHSEAQDFVVGIAIRYQLDGPHLEPVGYEVSS
jgi:hypothetical protein